jgi:hypothetical protein
MSEGAVSQLGQLAAVGVTTLLTAMATDLWSGFRQRATGLLGRGDRRPDSARRGVPEESWRQLQEAAAVQWPALAAARRGRWEASLRQASAGDPDLAMALAPLLADISVLAAAAASVAAGSRQQVAARYGPAVSWADHDGTQQLGFHRR